MGIYNTAELPHTGNMETPLANRPKRSIHELVLPFFEKLRPGDTSYRKLVEAFRLPRNPDGSASPQLEAAFTKFDSDPERVKASLQADYDAGPAVREAISRGEVEIDKPSSPLL